MNDKNKALNVACAIFSLVAAGHALRILLGIAISFNGREMPMVSSAGLAMVAAAMAFWTYMAGRD